MRRYLLWCAGLALLTGITACAVSVREIASASPVGMPPMASCPSSTYITATGSGTFRQPGSCTHLIAEVIAGGGTANTSTNGGGGGGYASSGVISLPAGTIISYSNGSAGNNTWVCNSTSNCASVSDTAVIAGANGGALGTGGTGAIGAVKHNGGSAGGSSGGGGGAGGPNGNGNSGFGTSGGSGDAGFGGAGGGHDGTELGGGLGSGGGGNGNLGVGGNGGKCGGGGGLGTVTAGIGASGCIKLTPSN